MTAIDQLDTLEQTTPPAITLPLSLAEFIRRYEQDGPFEIINGEWRAVHPTISKHSLSIKQAFLQLYTQGEQQRRGEVFTETAFVLEDRPDWVAGSRVPDVMFYTAARLTAYRAAVPDWKDKPFILVPDLVIEVVSETDRYSEVNQKVAAYLNDGVRLIWVIDPQRRRVTVHAGSTFTVLTGEDTLSGGDVLPDFSLPVDDLLP